MVNQFFDQTPPEMFVKSLDSAGKLTIGFTDKMVVP